MASWKDIRVLSKKDMDKRIARFSKLKGSDGGLPDSPLPECKRTLYAVIGFQPPKKANRATTSPVGDNAATMPAMPAPRISTELPAGGRDSLMGPSKLEPSAKPSSVMAWYMAALPATTPIIWNRLRRLAVTA